MANKKESDPIVEYVEQPQDTGKQATPDDLDEYLGNYQKPLDIVESANDQTQEDPSWKGNPNYYQTGKKKGQLKKPYKEEMEITGDLMDGAMFITLVDMVLPMLICLGNNAISKIKVEPDKLMLTEKQKNQLAPLAEQVVKRLSVKADPTILLCVSLFTMYGVQFYSIRHEAEQEMKFKK
jgi:hypothetical protein